MPVLFLGLGLELAGFFVQSHKSLLYSQQDTHTGQILRSCLQLFKKMFFFLNKILCCIANSF